MIRMPKVDLFYLKSTKELYAYSANEKLVSKFKKERNMKLFYHNREKIPEIAFKAFMSNHNNLMLIEIPLYDGKNYYMMTGTPKEDFKLSRAAEYIDETFAYIKSSLEREVKFNEKYTKLINDLTSIVSKKEVDCKYDLELELDTFELFMLIARDTFIDCSDLEDNNLLKNIE